MIICRSVIKRSEVKTKTDTKLHLEYVSTNDYDPNKGETFAVECVVTGNTMQNGQSVSHETRWVYPGLGVGPWDDYIRELMLKMTRLSQDKHGTRRLSAEYVLQSDLSGLVIGLRETKDEEGFTILLRFPDVKLGTPRQVEADREVLETVHNFIFTTLGGR